MVVKNTDPKRTLVTLFLEGTGCSRSIGDVCGYKKLNVPTGLKTPSGMPVSEAPTSYLKLS